MVDTASISKGFKNLFLLGLCTFTCAVPIFGSSFDSGPRAAQEHWYRIDIANQPAGWMVARESWTDTTRSNSSKLLLRFKRGAVEQQVEIESLFEESFDGAPKKAWIRQAFGSKPIEITYRYTANGITSESVQDGKKNHQILTLPSEDWLSPGQAQDTIRSHIEARKSSFELRTVDPQTGILPFETHWQLEQRDVELQVEGRPVMTTKWRQSQSLTPGLESMIHLDTDGVIVNSATPLMGMVLTMTLVSQDQALAHSDSPELLLETFIYPDRIIKNPRRLEKAHFEIEVADGELGELPSMGYQKVVNLGSRASVTIDLSRQPTEHLLGDEERQLYLRSSTFLQHKDPNLAALHRQASQDLPSAPAKRAEAFRRFVDKFLQEKNLDSVLATASEVAVQKTGDCTEHSVLLAALLRADGIPARVVAGLLYVDDFAGAKNFFGYHMWTQANLANRWIDLDATLSRPFDATHIAFVTTALSDNGTGLSDLGQISSLIGRAKIRVLDPPSPTPPNSP